MAQEGFEKMKKYLIILLAIMLISFMMSTMFFFTSGFFDFEKGQVTPENARTVLSELEKYGLKVEVNENVSLGEKDDLIVETTFDSTQ